MAARNHFCGSETMSTVPETISAAQKPCLQCQKPRLHRQKPFLRLRNEIVGAGNHFCGSKARSKPVATMSCGVGGAGKRPFLLSPPNVSPLNTKPLQPFCGCALTEYKRQENLAVCTFHGTMQAYEQRTNSHCRLLPHRVGTRTRT